MSEGCRWHRNRLRPGNWVVPPFEVTETIDKLTPPAAEGVELVPEYDGDSCKWLLKREKQNEDAAETAHWAKDIEIAKHKFLYGREIEESDFV